MKSQISYRSGCNRGPGGLWLARPIVHYHSVRRLCRKRSIGRGGNKTNTQGPTAAEINASTDEVLKWLKVTLTTTPKVVPTATADQ